MASIRKEIVTAASPAQVWDRLRDIGALHTRLVPGFVIDTKLDGNVRTVTFANGMVAKETIVDIDDAAHRVVWTATGGPLQHHNGSAQVFDHATGQARVVWIADVLPNEAAGSIEQMMDAGMKAMKTALDKLASI